MNEYVQQQYRQAEETLLLARASRMDRLLQSDFRQTSLSWILVQFWLCTLISAALFGFAGLLVYSLTDMTFWFSTPRPPAARQPDPATPDWAEAVARGC